MRFDIRRYDTTASTNDDAKQAAQNGAAEGTVFWALRQDAGRGRQGRAWESPEGNLYFSLVLRPPVPVSDWGLYSFAAALAVGGAIADTLPEGAVTLKWPNDVLVQGKKISGILLESGEGWLVAGIGLNVRACPDKPLYPATSLEAEGGDCLEIEALLTKTLVLFDVWYGRLNREGFAPVREAWLEGARKGPVRVRLPDGDIEGEFADLDVHGRLIVHMPDGTHKKVGAGDVFF